MNLPEFLVEETAAAIQVAGHRIGLEHVVHFYREGYSAEGLLDQFPSLTLPLIHKIIAFYLENRASVDEYVERARSAIHTQASAGARGPEVAELQRRYEAMQRARAS